MALSRSSFKLRLMLAQSVTVVLLLVLPESTAGQNESQVLSFESSIQRSNRSFACPGEVVTYHCVTHGTKLRWDVDDVELPITFGANDMPPNVMLHNSTEKMYWAVLNGASPSRTNDDFRYCHSMLIVLPGKLSTDNQTLVACGPQCSSSSINCSAIGNDTDMEGPLRHQIAVKPMQPMRPQFSYNSSKCWITIEVQMPEHSVDLTDMDFYEIVFNNTNTSTIDKRQMKAADDSNTASLTIRYIDLPSTFIDQLQDGVISISVTAVDKCGQRSNQSAPTSCNLTGLLTCSMMMSDSIAHTETSNLSYIGFWSMVIGVLIAAVI